MSRPLTACLPTVATIVDANGAILNLALIRTVAWGNYGNNRCLFVPRHSLTFSTGKVNFNGRAIRIYLASMTALFVLCLALYCNVRKQAVYAICVSIWRSLFMHLSIYVLYCITAVWRAVRRNFSVPLSFDCNIDICRMSQQLFCTILKKYQIAVFLLRIRLLLE